MILKKRTFEYSSVLEEYSKYKTDIVNFAEECVLANCKTVFGRNPRLDYTQKNILRSFMEDHYLCILNTRQVGITTVLKALVSHLMIFEEKNLISVVL